MTELDWLAPIHVTDHAVQRARERLGWDDRARIAGEVRSGVLEGRVAARRPNWTRGCGYDGVVGEARYVWNEGASRCWVLAVSQTGGLFVKTVLLDPDTHHAVAADLHLRAAFRPT